MTTSLPGSSREEADVTTPSQEGSPEMEAVGSEVPQHIQDEANAWHREHYRAGVKRLTVATVPSWIASDGDARHAFAAGFNEALDFAETARLAAAVVSSPATPAPPKEWERCRQCGGLLTGIYVVFPGASPATPNGQGDRFCMDCGPDRYRCEKHRRIASPASPAETREGREPDATLVEAVSAKVHDAWMETKRAQGVESRPSEWGEEQMVPYAALSDRAKDLDRGTVKAVLTALAAASPAAVPLPEETERETLRVPVQEDGGKPRGSIEWWEHVEAWNDYHKRFRQQDALTIAKRGGFGYNELLDHLGHEPTTWREGSVPRPTAAPALPGEQPGGQR